MAATNLRYSNLSCPVPSLLHPQETQTPALPSVWAPACQLHWFGSHSLFCVSLSVLPAQLDSVGTNCIFILVSLSAEPLHMQAWGPFPATPQLPFLKHLYVTPTFAALSHGAACHMLHFPKKRKSLSVKAVHILPVLTVLGDRVCLWNSPGWHCSCG